MNATDVKRLIHSGETYEVEFKYEPDQSVLPVKLDDSSLKKLVERKLVQRAQKLWERKLVQRVRKLG